MRTVFLFMMVSIDGYFEGSGHDLSWHNADNNEFTQFADKQLDEADTLIFGHTTYDMMAHFWPTTQAMEAAPSTASRMNALHKVVFSHSPLAVTWENTEVQTDPVTYIEELKKQSGKAIAVLGSSNLSTTLLEHGLLDELRIMVNPIALGSGTPLFESLHQAQRFKPESTRNFESGNILLRYAPNK